MTEQVEEQVVRMSINDLIYAQQKDLGKRMDRLENRIDSTRQELNERMNRLEQHMDKIDERLDKLDDKIDALRRDLMTRTNHGQISTISTIGIALAVVYSVLR